MNSFHCKASYQPKAKNIYSSTECQHSCPDASCSHEPEEKASQMEKNVIEDFPMGRFMRFLKHLKIKKLLAKIKDPRDPKKTEYSIEVILMWVLSVFFFRCGSTNALQTAFDNLPLHKRDVLWNYFELDSKKRAKRAHRRRLSHQMPLFEKRPLSACLLFYEANFDF